MNNDRPIISLSIAQEGKDPVAVNLDNRLSSLSYEEDEKKADKLKLVLDNYDFELLDSPIFKKGNLVIASWGYAGNVQSSTCIIERTSGDFNGAMTVECLHKGFLLHKNKHSRVFDNMTRSEVARAIAEKNGYLSEQQDIEDTRTKHRHISQAAMTDAEFVKRLANAENYQFWIDETGFHFHKRKFNQKPLKTLRWFTDMTGEIIAGTWESESKKKKGKVHAEVRDPMLKKTTAIEATNTTVKRTALASIVEPIDRENGVDTFQARMADDDIRPSTESSAAAAKPSTEAGYEKGLHTTFMIKLTVVGDPRLRAKSIIDLSGIGKRYSGLWYVKKCTHHIEDHYTTVLEMVRDGHNGYKGVSTDTKNGGDLNKQKAPDGPTVQIKEVVAGGGLVGGGVRGDASGQTHLEFRK